MQEFKIRASAAGKLMTRPKGGTNEEKYLKEVEKLKGYNESYDKLKNKQCKTALELINTKIPEAKKSVSDAFKIKDNPVFSQTTKSYVNEWYIAQVYGIVKEFYSKYTEKGIMLEDEGIDKAIQWLDIPFAIKNDEYFENEYFTGTPDLILPDEIIDVKCSWDAFSFPLLEDELPNKDYFYQLQVYMHLTGKKKSRVVYMLLNTPTELAKYETNYTYDHVPQDKRIKAFEVEYDASIIEYLQGQVIAIREHLETYKNK